MKKNIRWEKSKIREIVGRFLGFFLNFNRGGRRQDERSQWFAKIGGKILGLLIRNSRERRTEDERSKDFEI